MSKKPSKRRRAEEPSHPALSAATPALTPKAKRRVVQDQCRQERRKRWLQVAVVAGLVIAVGVVLAVKFGTAPDAVSLAAVTPPASTGAPAGPVAPAGTAEEQLDQLLAAGQPVFAFFHSNNCVQCTRMIAIVNQVYPEFAGSVALLDVNVYDAQNQRLLQEVKLQFIPTQIFYDRAGRSQTTVGVMEAEQLRQQLQALGGGQQP